MSIVSNTRKAAELAAIAKPAGTSPSCNVYSWGICFMVDPLELVRIFQLLNVRKSALKISTSDEYTHFKFDARGAEWTSLVKHEDVPAFYQKLGANTQPKLTAKQPRIGVKPRQPLLIPPSIGGAS
jgi:hypothetical protein